MKNSPNTLSKRNRLRQYWRETIDPSSFPHQIERLCKDCGQLRPCQWTSGFTQTGNPEYRARCRDCHNAYGRGVNKRARRARTTKSLDRKMLRKQKCVDYLGGKCQGCGYSACIKALTFHHRDPGSKVFEIAQYLDYAWVTLENELAKCDLLCFNCHICAHLEEA